jgi:general secretion pathway protein M
MATPSSTKQVSPAAFWQGLQPRERLAVVLAATVLGAYLLWAVALAPALRSLRAAPAQHQTADAQLAEVRALASQAQALLAQRGAQAMSRSEAVRALELATQQTLGAASRVSMVGNRATVSVNAASPDALARWLAQARLNARLMPVETRLQRSGEGATLRLNGTVVLGGPALGDTP